MPHSYLETKTKPRRGRPKQAPNNPDFIAKRNEIIEVAARVFREKGYDSGTLKDVAEELGITTANIYYYLKNKEELLFEIIHRSVTLGLGRLAELEKEDNAALRLKKMMLVHARLMTEEKDMFTVLFDHKDRLSEEHLRIIGEKEKLYLNHFRRTIRDVINDGFFPDVDVENALHMIMGMCNWIYKWHRTGKDPDYETLVEDWFAIISPR